MVDVADVLLASLQLVAEAPDLGKALRGVLATVARFLDWDAGEAWMSTEAGDGLRLAKVWRRDGLRPSGDGLHTLVLRSDDGPIARAWRTGTACWCPDVGADSGFRPSEVTRMAGLQVAVAVPVMAGDRIPAVLAFFSRTAADENPKVMSVLAGVARALGLMVQRRWTEARLDEHEAMLRSLFDSSPQAILAVSSDGRIERANTEAERLFGYGRDELRALPAARLVPPRLRAAYGDHLTRFFPSARKRQMGRGAVLFAVRKDGTEFPVDIDLTPVGEGPRPLVMAVVHDVTERIEAQRRFRRILESAPDGMLLVNRAGSVVIANGRAEALFGYGRGGLRGIEVDMLVPPADRERHRRGVERFFAEPRVMHLDAARTLNGLRRDSTTFPVEIDVAPLETQETGVLAIVSVRDLTARRAAEREREELLHALQTERERLRRLSARLLEAQETERRTIARELHDQLGQALTAVTLDLQCLRRDVNPAQHAAIDGLVGSVRAIVSQARDLSLALRPSVLDDLGLAAAMRWYLERQDQRGPHVGFVDEIRDLRVTPAVEVACFRITQEAVTNALRHAVARRVSVDLRTGDDQLQLVVSDDGVGFDVEAARARAVAGGSMGLLGMEERAALVGGRLAIETEPGLGTRVRACFPL